MNITELGLYITRNREIVEITHIRSLRSVGEYPCEGTIISGSGSGYRSRHLTWGRAGSFVDTDTRHGLDIGDHLSIEEYPEYFI